MFKIMGRLLRMAAFWNDRRGNVAIIAGLSLLPITVLAGSAIDMADIIADRSRIQHALDIAALDTARKISNDLDFADNESDVLDYAVSAFHANFPDSQVSGSRITTNDGRLAIDLSQTLVRNAGVVREVKLTADADHSPAFMGIALGNGAIETKTVAAAMVRNDTFDVVMVLDNSGSMGGNRISTLRSAATDLTNILMAMNDTGGVSDRVQVGLVPFSTYVNVGPTRINANWLDKEGLSSIHSENFDTPTNRFTLFDQMTDISWAGCVESRPSPYDVTDAKPKKKTPDTLFVPVFAPDEPDWDNDDGDSYYNDYLDDEGGSCTGNLPNGSDRPVAAQARTCKYSGTPSSSATNDNGTNSGPNQLCHVQPLTVLTLEQDKGSQRHHRDGGRRHHQHPPGCDVGLARPLQGEAVQTIPRG